MFFQALSFDLKTVTVSPNGRVLFYNNQDQLVLGIKQTSDFQLHYSEKFLYVWLEGAKPYFTSDGQDMTMAYGSLYKMTVFALEDIDGKPFTAITDTVNYDLGEYEAKLLEAFEWMQEVVLEGCCGGGSGSSSVAFYADFASFPVTGTVDVLYVDKATPALYLWDGSAYVAFGGGGGGVASVTGNIVDNTDPANPVVTQVQADWNETDNTQPDYILNKPDLDTLPYIPLAGTASGSPVTGDVEYLNATSRKALKMSDGLREYLVWFIGAANQMRVGNFLTSNPTFGSYAAFLDDYIELSSGDSSNGQVSMRLYQAIKTIEIASTTSNFKGITYGANYSADMVLRSLIDQEVMKSRIWTKAGIWDVNDDSTKGFVQGSLLWDTTNSILYRCTSNTVGAATWVEAIQSNVTLYDTIRFNAALTGGQTLYAVPGLSGTSASSTNNLAAPTTHTDFRVAMTSAQHGSGTLVIDRIFTNYAGTVLATHTLTIPAGSAAGTYTFTGSTYDASGGSVLMQFRIKNNATSTSGIVLGLENQYL